MTLADGLLLRLPADPAGPVAWVQFGQGRVSARGDDAVAEGPALAANRRVIALAPGECVLLTSTEVPSRKPHHVRRAIPFLLEERLAEEVGRLHFALGPRDEAGRVAVAVVARDLLARWIDALEAAGLAPAAIVPEPLLLPLDEDGWTLAVDAHRAQLRCGPWTGWTLDRDALEVLLSRALDEAATPPGSLTVWGVESDAFGSAAGRVGTIRHADAPDLETLLSRGGDAPPALDLLQGAFARETETRFRWRDWRLPAALAAGLLLLLLGQKLWQVSELADESEHLDDRLRATLRESVPDIRRVVDPVAQMRQELAARRGGAGDARFLDLLAATGRVLGDETGWQLAGLDYRDGTLQLQLRMPGFDHFERLRARFAASDGIEAEVGSLGSAEGEVRGSVTVRGGGA